MGFVDKKVECLMCNPHELDGRDFVYPEMVAKGQLYAEEVEEAIIEYLEKRGFDRDKLQSCGEWKYTDSDGTRTTKLLMVYLV